MMIRSIAFPLLSALCVHAQVSVLMNRYDAASTGANTHETILKPSNVDQNGFGKLYSYYVDGAVYAQPLYVPAVAIPGRSSHNVPYTATVNVLYVATMNDKVYAFDADQPGPPLWMRDLTDELPASPPCRLPTSPTATDLNIVGNVGILGTPVIDPSSHAIFLRGAHARKRPLRSATAQARSCARERICSRPPSSRLPSRARTKMRSKGCCTSIRRPAISVRRWLW